MNTFRMNPVNDDWAEVRSELERGFQMARKAAQAEESFVFVVHHDDLLGRRGAGNAMVATGLLSAVRTAAIEGSRKGWTANVVAYDDTVPEEWIVGWAQRLGGETNGVTGELVRLGSSHIGKALP